MKTVSRILIAGMCMVLLTSLCLPVLAQDEPATGSGAPVILPNFGADPATFNQIISNDGTSNAVIQRLFPSFIGVDPETGFLAPGVDGALVTDWTASDDNLVYTFTLRDDLFWTDGTAVTSADVQYFWDAISDLTVNVSGSFVDLRDIIASVESPDAQTLVVTFNNPDCNAINSAAGLSVVPAHYYSAIFPERADMNESELNMNPEVTAGQFTFLNFRPGEQVTLRASETYPDSTVIPAGWIYKNVADQTVQAEQFLAGQITSMGVPTARVPEFSDLVAAGDYLGFFSTRANMRFVSFNTGDPSDPQPATDEAGNRIDQGQHPVFGGYTADGVATPGGLKVRQALNFAMNFEEINAAVCSGTCIQSTTHSRSDNWAHPAELEVYPFDVAMANQLLDEAGWLDNDGDGVRECVTCDYSVDNPDFVGSPLEFNLKTNAGNTSQETLGTLLQDQWADVGVKVNFSAIDFNVLVEELTGQTYDAVMIFWGFSFPADPDDITGSFGQSADIPASGFNTGSYYNARVEELIDTARALPGCDVAERAEMYKEAYTILHDESPWIWVGIAQTLQVGQLNIEGWDPRETVSRIATWNEDAWNITQ